ncbi:MAG: hypothetical protein ACRD51_09910, partial [Candidatus Acidiferrum sp.]
MRHGLANESHRVAATLFAVLALFLLSPLRAAAWGRNAQKLIANQAIDTLPEDLRTFFEANRAFLLLHVNDPLDELVKTPAEKRNNHLYLDKYGRFPFDLLPRSYKAA